MLGEGNSDLQGWGRAPGMVGHCGKALLRSKWLKGALMPPSVAGLCRAWLHPDRSTGMSLMHSPSLQACLGCPGMWPKAPPYLSCSLPILAQAPVGL